MQSFFAWLLSNESQNLDAVRTEWLNETIAQNDARFVVFKNTVISYIFRKRFLKLVRAITALQRRAKLRRHLDSETKHRETMRWALKYRSALVHELSRVDAIIKANGKN